MCSVKRFPCKFTRLRDSGLWSEPGLKPNRTNVHVSPWDILIARPYCTMDFLPYLLRLTMQFWKCSFRKCLNQLVFFSLSTSCIFANVWLIVTAQICSAKIRQSTIYYAGLLGRWNKWIVDQESDVPSIIFLYFL